MKLPARLSDPWFEARFYVATKMSWFDSNEGTPYAFSESNGLLMWCPCGYGQECYPLEGARPHAIVVPFSNPPNGVVVPPEHGPESSDGKARPRWAVSGSSLEDLTISPSIDVGSDHCWHGHIVNGEVR